MGLLLAPDEVKSMHEKIDQLVEAVNSQGVLPGQIFTRANELGAFETDLKNLQLKMEHPDNSVTTIKDCVRFK
jgi:hypothetical protein